MFQLDTVRVSLPLKQKFVVSKGGTDVKTNLLTVLNNRYNGEASGSVHYGPSIDDIEKDIKKGIEKIQGFKEITIETLEDVSNFKINPIARSALVAMLLNYISGETRRYPWEVLALGSPVGIKSSITISIDKPSEMIDALERSDYPIIKLKMGNEEDIMLLDAIDKVRGKEIRVDVNGAWSCAKAEEMIFHLSRKGVKIIEQPTDTAFVQEWPHLKGKATEVELVLDEGLNTSEDYSDMAEYVDGINIKMEKCGGILEAVRIADKAQADKKKVMLGCMVESSVGIAQSVYMSSKADYFDLDGPLLLQDDIADGIKYDRESIEVDREIIGGPKLKRDVMEKYISG
ncbi:MAG: enolase C-terminal domain-like protein [Candidatus Zixiibacteriota bacterium]